MAELEAITEIRPTKDKPKVQAALFTRRFPLVAGKQYRLGRDEAKMDFAVPEDDQVSRYYANVSYEPNRVRVDRRGPVPPDYPDAPVNKIVVRDPKARDRFLDVTGWDVGPGESFWIGQTQFTLHEDNRAPLASLVSRSAAPAHGTPDADAQHIATMLRTNHVCWEHAETNGLMAAVLEPRSPLLADIGRGFHRTVVIDSARGQTAGSEFDADTFFAEVRRRISDEFGLGLDAASVHTEDVFQILKDEPPSLLCFANFDPVPVRCFPQVRSFTQGVHRVLLLNRGARDLAAEEAADPDLERDESSVVSQTMVKGGSQAEAGYLLHDPVALVAALRQLPSVIRAAVNEQGLYRQMLQVVMKALPLAHAAGVVRIPPDTPPGERRLAVVEANVSPMAALAGGFAPSRRLAYKAILEQRRSCLQCGSAVPTESGLAQVMAPASPQKGANQTPWAICTPFQDGSKFALYVSGRITGQWNALGKAGQDRLVRDLEQCQQSVELIVAQIETTLRMNRLAKQNSFIRQAWHRELWPFMDRPEVLEQMLEPQVKEMTILFCDIRRQSGDAWPEKDDLLGAWRNVSLALDTMSSTVTDFGGVVSGFQGDAMLAFWGWPEPKDTQVEMAALAAARIWSKLTQKGMTCGVGVTHGPTLVGRLGAHDLAVVDLYGPVVDLAFELETATKAFGVGMVASATVADHLGASGKLRTRPLGNVLVPKFPDPVPAFELYSTDAPPVEDVRRPAWDAAVGLFTAGAWADADRVLVESFPDDPASMCLRRVMNKLGTGDDEPTPPPDWAAHRSFVPAAP